MSLLEDLPEDLITVLLGVMYKTSIVSIKVFPHVNKFCYRISAKYAIQHNIKRPLKCKTIASEGLLEVLQWARFNGCEWDSYTCDYAVQYGHLHVLQWARENGCNWDSNIEKLAKEKWPHIFS